MPPYKKKCGPKQPIQVEIEVPGVGIPDMGKFQMSYQEVSV